MTDYWCSNRRVEDVGYNPRMPQDPFRTVVRYHDGTKHHPHRYARSLGYLDWENQPDPFRRFDGAPLIRLPIPPAEDSPFYDDLFVPGVIRPRPLNAESISRFFYLSLALSAWKQAGSSRWSLRCNPSSGNLHPTESYGILPVIGGVSDSPAVCHYAPLEHGLEIRCRLSTEAFSTLTHGFPGDCWFVGLSSVHWREAWKYGERAFRYCNHDVGHALAALRFAAAALGWRLIVLDNLADAEVSRVLGLDRSEDFTAAELEHPDLVAAVFPAHATGTVPLEFSETAIQSVAAGSWIGQANRLSAEHVDWEIIDAVADATAKPRTTNPPTVIQQSTAPAATSRPDRPVSASHIIRSRRSALAFDGRTSLSASVFFHMLERVMPDRRRAPWDALSWTPRIHLFLFVHLLDGLPPGIYAIVRDPGRFEEFKRAGKHEFAWETPADCPDGLPLFLLMRADCRRAAAQLSLGQDIAGLSAFSLGMIADFERPLDAHGAWYYRRLYWEAGMIGQVLYLEAEAAGLRATGIGAYFDDRVHDVLGFTGHRFQSLYHFTVGGPVEDPRITSAPAYPSITRFE